MNQFHRSHLQISIPGSDLAVHNGPNGHGFIKGAGIVRSVEEDWVDGVDVDVEIDNGVIRQAQYRPISGSHVQL